MTKLVTDIPIWEDCPFRAQVPVGYEIRLEKNGVAENVDMLVIWSSEHEIHVDIALAGSDLEDLESFEENALAPAIANLEGFAAARACGKV